MGHVSPTYSAVAEAFSQGLSEGVELGAGLCVYQDGQCVVDLVGGYSDRRKTNPWTEDTLCCFFSISKALSTLCVLQAVDEGLLNLDTPVATYWPEFAQNNKADVTVQHLLTHQAGLCAFEQPVDADIYYHWDQVIQALQAQSTWWKPGAAHGYHARTFGYLLGEVLFRATGVKIDEWLHIRLAPQLDLYFGLDGSNQARCADILLPKLNVGAQTDKPQAMQDMLRDYADTSTLTGKTFQNPKMPPRYMNTEQFRAAVMPAVNGHGTAKALAQLFSRLPNLVSKTLLLDAITAHSHGADLVLKSKTKFGLGFMLYEAESPIGWSGCFGHAGAGGSVVFYDPEHRISFAFVMNQMHDGVVTAGPTAKRCIDALHAIVR